MSQENIEAFNRCTDAQNRRDVEAMLGELDADVEWRSAIFGSLSGEAAVLRGHHGFRTMLRELYEAFGEFQVEYPEIRDLGDRLVAFGRWTSRREGSGAETATPVTPVVDFRNGKAIRVWTYFDSQQALDAAGLSAEAMSRENVELVRRGMESAQAFWALFDERIVFNMRLVPDSDGEYVGREAAIRAGRQYWGTFEDYQLDALELIEAGSSVVVVVRERGRGRGSGAPFERRWAQVWTFRSGRIVRWEAFPDRAAALQAVGLRE